MISIQGTDSLPIAVRCFAPDASGIPVLMLHGLQSHSEWFSQSAYFISRLEHPVYAIDRRGSGLSPAPRGDIDRFERYIDEIGDVCDYVKASHGVDKMHFFGHCFGAIPALATVYRYPGIALSLILTSPGFHTRTDLPVAGKARVILSLALPVNPYIPVPLKPEDFTDLPDIRAFIANDPLALREATAGFWLAIHQLRRYVRGAAKKPCAPIFTAFSARDNVSRTNKNIPFICGIESPARWLVTYEQASHILEFSDARDAFFYDLALWLARWA